MNARRGVSLAAAALFALATMGADSCKTGGSSSSSSGSSEPSAKEKRASRPFRATSRRVEQLVVDELGKDVDTGTGDTSSLDRVRDVACSHGRCTIDYNADTPFIKVEKTLLEEARPIWERLFSDKRFKEATITPWAETTSVGGKASQSPVMHVTCDRAANREIDWDAVDSHGIEALCTYEQLVNFD